MNKILINKYKKTMKKITSIMAMLLMAMMPFALTSCDEDDEIAMTLEGTWQGDMKVYYDYNGHNYDATWSEICFEGNPFNWDHGTGYWVDYYKGSPWKRDYIASHIRWNVDHGIINVTFKEDNYKIQINNYRLSDSRFRGTIYDGDKKIEFSLRHVESPYWDGYDYGWGDYDRWAYYSKSFGDVETPKAPERPVRHFGTPKK